MLKHIDFIDNMQIIDVAGGTGDIAFRLATRAQELQINYHIEIADINSKMLDVGKASAVDKNLFVNLSFKECDGENYPTITNHLICTQSLLEFAILPT